jgi:hypothetical protein
MKYVIKRGNLYVSRPGSQHSYTKFLQEARIFSSREEAEKHTCPDNERIVSVDSELNG